MKANQIKILYIIDDLYSQGGMQRVLTLKANYLAEVLDYDVTIVLTEEKELPFFYPLSPLVKTVNLDINFYRMYNQTSMPLKVIKYKYYMRRYKNVGKSTHGNSSGHYRITATKRYQLPQLNKGWQPKSRRNSFRQK